MTKMGFEIIYPQLKNINIYPKLKNINWSEIEDKMLFTMDEWEEYHIQKNDNEYIFTTTVLIGWFHIFLMKYKTFFKYHENEKGWQFTIPADFVIEDKKMRIVYITSPHKFIIPHEKVEVK